MAPEERFHEYHKQNPDVYRSFVTTTLAMQAEWPGKKFSAGVVFVLMALNHFNLDTGPRSSNVPICLHRWYAFKAVLDGDVPKGTFIFRSRMNMKKLQ